MLMFASFAAAVAAVSAIPYSGYSGYSKVLPSTFSTGAVPAYSTGYTSGLFGGFGTLNRGFHTTGLARGYNHGFNGAYNHGFNGAYTHGLNGAYTYGSSAVAPLAVQTSHQVQYADVPSGGSVSPVNVEVDANPIPMNMVFRSASSQLNVEQAHQGAQGSVQESASEDEPHVLRHSVNKPVMQEVKEVITPFRKITQEVQPVREEIQTVVARGVNKAVVAAPALATVKNFATPITHTMGHMTHMGHMGHLGHMNMNNYGTYGAYGTRALTGFTTPVHHTTGYTSGYSNLTPSFLNAKKYY